MLQRLDQNQLDSLLKESQAGQKRRPKADSKIECGRFEIKEREFVNQYAGLYFSRLASMRKAVVRRAKERWPGVPVAAKLLEIPRGTSVVVGTLYKEMGLRPSVLEEYTRSRADRAKAPPRPGAFFTGEDALVLEDAHARIPVSYRAGARLPAEELVSGIVVAFLGVNNAGEGASFRVEDMVAAGAPSQGRGPGARPPPPEEDQYLVLTSGLRFGGGASSGPASQMMIDYVTGLIGGEGDQERASRIVQVVVAGNSVAIEQEEDEYAHFSAAARRVSKNDNDKSLNHDIKSALERVDIAFTSLAASVNVAVMPGEQDPANLALPQQKLPRFLFQSAAAFSTFRCATNPCKMSVAGRAVLGTSGQNIDDLKKCCRAGDALELLERTLKWGHLAPTAPDTLGCYAFKDKDPFVLEECPDVYFAANQDEFAAKVVEGEMGQKVCLVAVPDFSKTGSIAVVNLRTLECEQIKFTST